MPARHIAISVSSDSLAGPMVQTIFVYHTTRFHEHQVEYCQFIIIYDRFHEKFAVIHAKKRIPALFRFNL